MTGLLALAAIARPALLPPTAPKLVLLISIDQGRADYIDRYSDLYLPAKKGGSLGGFRWLSETGVRYLDAHHHHLPTATGPGHSVLMTGSTPAINGIVGNDWFDRTTGKSRYVTDDPSVQTVGGTMNPMSARPLKVTTVGDELKMATNGRSKVVGLAFKDRASILMAGHAADEVIWYDFGTGALVTSTYYAPDKRLPSWVEQINRERGVDKAIGTAWKPSLPTEKYALSRRAPHEKPLPDGTVFSHDFGTQKNAAYYGNVVRSTFGQRFIFDAAERALDAEKLGQHDVPDVFVLNLSTNDYVGHAWGPYSPEALDTWVQTDRMLSHLFNKLDRTIPGGIDNVAIVVSADHGVAPIPGEAADVYRVDSARFDGAGVVKAVKSALDAKFGSAAWVQGGLYEQNIYLNRAEIASHNLKPEDVETVAARAAQTVPGVYTALTRTQIVEGRVPNAPWAEWVYNGFSPNYGGDIFVLSAPGQVDTGPTGTSHGTVWAYDTHVPILTHWAGQKPQQVGRRVYTHDIASTLSILLGIEYPSGNVGKPLTEALPTK